MSGDFTITIDRTGFPLLRLNEWKFRISLLPVSNYQFERFLSSGDRLAGRFTDRWYRSYLGRNPRSAYIAREWAPWKLFLTGLPATDLEPFFSYLGRGFRFPTVEERSLLVESADRIAAEHGSILEQVITAGCPDVVVQWVTNRFYPLVKQHTGLPEYVAGQDGLKCMGSPWNEEEFYPNCWEPLSVRPLSPTLEKYMGFRLATF